MAQLDSTMIQQAWERRIAERRDDPARQQQYIDVSGRMMAGPDWTQPSHLQVEALIPGLLQIYSDSAHFNLEIEAAMTFAEFKTAIQRVLQEIERLQGDTSLDAITRNMRIIVLDSLLKAQLLP